MSGDKPSKSALDALIEIRNSEFPDLPEELVREMLEIEKGAQFEGERKPIVAKLRDLIMEDGEQ
jgi:hypothetical protein